MYIVVPISWTIGVINPIDKNKLGLYNISGTFLNVVKYIYENAKSCAKVNTYR